MIKLLRVSRHLRYFLEAQIIGILLLKRKNYMDKVLPQLRYPGDTFMPVGNTYHGFSGFYLDLSYVFKLTDKMVE